MILHLLSGLLDKSLVQIERSRGAPRYRLLEPVRQYAAQVLEQSGDSAVLRRRHRDWYLALAERAETRLWTGEQHVWLVRLEHEHDNLRAILDWCLTAEGDAEMGLRLARSLWQFWLLRGHYSDGRYWLETLLNVAPATVPRRAEVFLQACALAARRDAAAAGALADQGIRAFVARHDQHGRVKAMHLRGMIAWLQFDYPRACAFFEDALAQAKEVKLPEEAALLTHSVGFMRWWQGDIRQARALMEMSLQQVQALDGKADLATSFLHLGWMPLDDHALGPTEMTIENSLLLLREISASAVAAHILANLGCLARCAHDHERAGHLLEESLLRFERLGDRVGRAQVLGQLGNLARVHGDYSRARARLEDCLALRREIGESRGIAHALVSLGNLALAEGDAPGAGAQIEAGLTAVRQIQDRPAIAWTSASQASRALRVGDLNTARVLYRDLVAHFRSYGAESQGQALSLAGLGMIAKHEQDYASSRFLLTSSLALWREVGDRRSCAALLYQLGDAAMMTGDRAAAGACFAESLAHFRAMDDAQGAALVEAAMACVPMT
jgi:tetratricopeptide (TPR) repeat protein